MLKVLLEHRVQQVQDPQEHRVHREVRVILVLLDLQVSHQVLYYCGKETLVIYLQVGCFVMDLTILQILEIDSWLVVVTVTQLVLKVVLQV